MEPIQPKYHALSEYFLCFCLSVSTSGQMLPQDGAQLLQDVTLLPQDGTQLPQDVTQLPQDVTWYHDTMVPWARERDHSLHLTQPAQPASRQACQPEPFRY